MILSIDLVADKTTTLNTVYHSYLGAIGWTYGCESGQLKIN